jgi:hypothetical protein
MTSQLQACQCAPDPAALHAVVLPSVHDGQPAPGLRFGDPRVMALLACLCHYGHLFAGLTNRSLRELVADLIPGYTAHARRPTTCAASGARASSAASPAPNATSSPTTAA